MAFISGIGLTLAFPPYDIVVALTAYSALLLLMEAGEKAARRAWVDRMLIGAAFGFGAHLMGLWWVGLAFLVDADRYAALMPLAVIGLPLILAPFTALATVLCGLAPQRLAWRALALALAISFTEWLRGMVFTGFPWNVAGVGITQSTLLAQSASVVGLTGLSFVAVLFGTLPAVLIEKKSRWLAVPAGIILAVMAGFGAQRLLSAPALADDAPLIRVVQPAIPQRDKWDPEQRDMIWERLLQLTEEDRPNGGFDAVIWPETAIPFLYRTPSAEQAALAGALSGASLITGAVDMERIDGRVRTTNSVFVMDPDGALAARYDKAHLVPFGEYVPLAGVLSWLGFKALAAGDAVFEAGPGPTTIRHRDLPRFQPLICYEIIFPHLRADGAAQWIVNVTNDAWFGNTPGPRQHLRHARLRAIARGVPVVRAANTGISAVIDSSGQISEFVPLNTIGIITTRLPNPHPSVYSVLGDLPIFGLWFVGAFGVLVARRLT
ncbi:MAG: apolipoprotein N-acyltransferase [Pseudomonadota bacterium]